MVIKMDMEKAYDIMDWNFIQQTLIGFCFPNNIINLIMNCITTIKFSILINGTPPSTDNIIPTRGIRYGYPLSHYLFILRADILSNLIRIAQQGNKFSGITIAKIAPNGTHLFFGDDTMIFCKAGENEASTLLDMINKYQGSSRENINIHKSQMMFITNTSQKDKDSFHKRPSILFVTILRHALVSLL